MGKKKHVAHTNIYFYTVKTTAWSASIRCEKLLKQKEMSEIVPMRPVDLSLVAESSFQSLQKTFKSLLYC